MSSHRLTENNGTNSTTAILNQSTLAVFSDRLFQVRIYLKNGISNRAL